MDYTTETKSYYKILNKDTEEFLSLGTLEPNLVLSTIHTVVFITEEEYNDLNNSDDWDINS